MTQAEEILKLYSRQEQMDIFYNLKSQKRNPVFVGDKVFYKYSLLFDYLNHLFKQPFRVFLNFISRQ